ncbi:hypothetical protein BX286_6767 [Streptomyces sp. 3211.6]|uniref:hypothetical protein n=1 Tax=Streptomyces TaxID=1883 RepID=UPI0009A532D6|nr:MULTISPECIES: hypothetical protein [Streptomyces]RKT08654.1 hypothetical protein BX286_6767 [Streptomyces sp. 3211.6]RPF30049.1 hypothetical protein EDD96_6603 [Streptomyces sp. Ag109_G2-6]
MSKFRTREMTVPSRTAVCTVPARAEVELSNEELLERYPAVAEIMARWNLERMSDAEIQI